MTRENKKEQQKWVRETYGYKNHEIDGVPIDKRGYIIVEGGAPQKSKYEDLPKIFRNNKTMDELRQETTGTQLGVKLTKWERRMLKHRKVTKEMQRAENWKK